MEVECPKCKRRYKVDDSKVPFGGGPVRCPSCENIFTIYREPLDLELIPVETEIGVAPSEEVEVAAPELEAATPEVEVALPEVEAATPEMEAAVPEVEAPPPEVEVALPEVEEAPLEVEIGPPRPPEVEIPVAPPEVAPELDEGRNKAKRLARSLAKDILLYHGEEVERGLEEGRLADLIGTEIRKSWKYYKEQVPGAVSDAADLFKDALNEILCKGKKIFT